MQKRTARFKIHGMIDLSRDFDVNAIHNQICTSTSVILEKTRKLGLFFCEDTGRYMDFGISEI